jgi:hypothetical protein
VKGKTTLAEKGSRSSGPITLELGPHQNGVDERGGHGELDPQVRDLPQYADGHKLHLVVDTYAAHRCAPLRTAVRESGTWRNP